MDSNKIVYSRRNFVSMVTGLVGSSLVLAAPGVGLAESFLRTKPLLTVKQVIDSILKEIPGAPFPKTVDQLRSGSMDQEVTGIVTTMFPTIQVIEKTAKAGANLIIAHETPFYNNEDETEWLAQDDAYLYKVDLLKKYKIAIWRFHDYWHAHKPDGIVMGNLKKLGWDSYYDAASPRLLTLPKPLSIQSILALTKEKLGISTVRLLGDPSQICTTIFLAFGYMDSKMQIAAIQKYKRGIL